MWTSYGLHIPPAQTNLQAEALHFGTLHLNIVERSAWRVAQTGWPYSLRQRRRQGGGGETTLIVVETTLIVVGSPVLTQP